MAAIGLNIPPGFTLTTEVCQQYCSSGVPGEAALAPEVCTRGVDYSTLTNRLPPTLTRDSAVYGFDLLHARCRLFHSFPYLH